MLPPQPLLRSRLLRSIPAPRQEAKGLLTMLLPSMPPSMSPRRRLLLLRIMVDGKKYINLGLACYVTNEHQKKKEYISLKGVWLGFFSSSGSFLL